jgi:cytochrome c-type biogenesis protein CcmE
VVEGTMTPAGHFESRRLMVSHDNEYRVPGDGGKPDDSKLTCAGARTVASAGAARP